MSRSFVFWSLALGILVSALGLRPLAFGQPGRPPVHDDGHGHADHDEADDESGSLSEPAAAKVYTPEDVARRKQVLAKVAGVDITVAKVEDYIAQQSPMLRVRYKNPDELKKLVDNMVRFELLAAEAERQGYGKNKTVVRTTKDGAVQNLLRTEVEEKVTPQSVTDEEIKASYEANADEFHRPAQRRASHILVETEAEAKTVLEEAKKADARGFIELAKKYSKDLETKLRGGDLQFFTKEPGKDEAEAKVPAAVRKAAFDLKNVGDTVAKPVPVDGGFSIVRLTGERPERNTTLADAEQPIRTKLWREKRQKALADLVEGLRGKEKPQVFADRVDMVKLDDMEKQPEGFAPNPHGGANPHGGMMQQGKGPLMQRAEGNKP
jgi:peptidyl-prolyl cis-trans isomerase C